MQGNQLTTVGGAPSLYGALEGAGALILIRTFQMLSLCKSSVTLNAANADVPMLENVRPHNFSTRRLANAWSLSCVAMLSFYDHFSLF